MGLLMSDEYNYIDSEKLDVAVKKEEYLDGKKIKITWASITNYDEATAAFEYEYAYTEEIIEL